MRIAVTAVLALSLAACRVPREARADREEPAVFAELAAEVDKLPASPEKARIENLLDRIEPRVAAGGAVLRSGLDLSRIEDLSRLAEAMAPAAIEIGFSTDGKDWSGDGVDDGVELHLVPRDSTGSAVKIPGRVEAVLFRESGFGLNLPGAGIDQWTVSADTLRYAWNESLFPGYIARMPWHKGLPDETEAVLAVTFYPAAGRPLSARKRVEITASPAQSFPAPASEPAAQPGDS
jgi:hypothetical protein